MVDRCDVLASGLRFPEGPAFDPAGRLWAVELEAGGLVRLDRSGGLERFAVGGMPNGIAMHGDEPWFCDADIGAVRRLLPDGRCEHVTGGTALDRPNDLAFDRAGTLVFTCPGNSRTEPTGTVWRRTPDGALSVVAEGMLFPNGLAFTPDGAALIVAETYGHRLWRGAWDMGEGRWEGAPWCEVGGPIGPDGMAFGPDGLLYVAIYGQGRVAVVDDAGRVVRTIATPGAKPTNLAFDPLGRWGLVVTEAERGEMLSYPAAG